jgi:hypothetical protein
MSGTNNGEAIHLADMSQILTSGLNTISQGGLFITITSKLQARFFELHHSSRLPSSATYVQATMQHSWFLSFARSIFPSHQNVNSKGRCSLKYYCSILIMNADLTCNYCSKSSPEKRFPGVSARSTRLELQSTRLKIPRPRGQKPKVRTSSTAFEEEAADPKAVFSSVWF